MEVFSTLLIAALLIEGIVNIVQNIKEKETSWKYWTSLGLGIAFGVLIALNWHLNLFKMVGFSEGSIPFIGEVLTGIVISRGSNFVSDLFGRIAQPIGV